MHHSCLKSCILFSTLILELVCSSSFYFSCISNCILTAMPPPQLLKISGLTVIFFFRECVCVVVIPSVKWQELDSNYFHDRWVSFQSTLSIQWFGDFLFATEIQQKTTVFILLNDEKLFVGQNTICEDVTLATGSYYRYCHPSTLIIENIHFYLNKGV